MNESNRRGAELLRAYARAIESGLCDFAGEDIHSAGAYKEYDVTGRVVICEPSRESTATISVVVQRENMADFLKEVQ